MTVSDYVCYVLRVPANLDGFMLVTKAIQYVLDNDGDSRFYEYLQANCDKNYACIEKALRLAKTKAIEKMPDSDFIKVFNGEERDTITVKVFVCYAAQYYRKEFGNAK